MGASASSGVAAGVAAASPEELGSALKGLSADARAKLLAALSEKPKPEESRLCCTIEYDFKEQNDCDAWYDNFVKEGSDGFKVTAGAPGIKVCRLYRSTAASTTTRAS